jgi:hypothetical protein
VAHPHLVGSASDSLHASLRFRPFLVERKLQRAVDDDFAFATRNGLVVTFEPGTAPAEHESLASPRRSPASASMKLLPEILIRMVIMRRTAAGTRKWLCAGRLSCRPRAWKSSDVRLSGGIDYPGGGKPWKR